MGGGAAPLGKDPVNGELDPGSPSQRPPWTLPLATSSPCQRRVEMLVINLGCK